MPSPDRELLSVVAPCFNEAAGIERFHAELARVLDGLAERDALDAEILYVDDGSTDGTLAVLNELAARDPRIVPLALSRHFGKEPALAAGLDAARGHAVVILDSDLQHPPALIPRFVELWRAGTDVVTAVKRTSASAPLAKRLGSRAFTWMLRRISETKIEPGAADFGLLSRRACDAVRASPERHRFLRGLTAWIGFERALVPFDVPPRAAGGTSYDLRRLVALALDAVFSFSTAPIRLMIRVGLAVVAGGALALAIVVWRVLRHADMQQGWASLISVVLVLGGLQLVFTGVIGEYLARLVEQAKGRPLYVLKQGRDDAPARSAASPSSSSASASSGTSPGKPAASAKSETSPSTASSSSSDATPPSSSSAPAGAATRRSDSAEGGGRREEPRESA